MFELETMECEDNSQKPKLRKRIRNRLTDDDPTALRRKLMKKIVLCLTKPSYCLRECSRPLRVENRLRLRFLLRRLVRQQNWKEASGVLSVYLKGTLKDRSPQNNGFKYLILTDLVKHIKTDNMESEWTEEEGFKHTEALKIYELWMKKNGSMNSWPTKERCVILVQCILLSLLQGKLDKAEDYVSCLKQINNVESDALSNMILGLAYYEFWYSSVQKDFPLRDSDKCHSPVHSDMVGTRDINRWENLDGHNTVESDMADGQHECNSETSVINDQCADDAGDMKHKVAPMEVDVNQQAEGPLQINRSQCFYYDSDQSMDNEPACAIEDHVKHASFLSALEGLDRELLPWHLPHHDDNDNFEELIKLHQKLVNDNYNQAVKYFQLALHSTPPVPAAFIPLVQLLLIGGQVDEALKELEKLCCTSTMALPVRVRANLLEHLNPGNSYLLSDIYEDILKKDPTCYKTVAKLVRMHQTGDYGLEPLFEMIGLHLDATCAECDIWRHFSACFLKLSQLEEDRMSVCSNKDGHTIQHSSFFNSTPKIFTQGKSAKSWKLRCRWWLTRHFSEAILMSDITAGDLQLLTHKAACACHMYGEKFDYVSKAYSHLEKENGRDLLSILDMHKQNSIGLYPKLLSTCCK